ncbi:acidic fibroblast growth factor binding protein [Neocallimastix lanati (nom. inval.)]|jgi:hypothetical protein|uniref:Acidic fibroblast growth factor binding protein n=1 Tax=Neocallimastix californiae TaxID=1754190 RepID=A0A1Y2AJL0_9FUNG|nr:acidic fibroblast growth factor binding protein [Neocallimastix sp. JGI-2020a]ORY22706.1 acidic fibroblast growth factor binding protein [Neocallimastix californiae]|eukprot:ORY22706.1 acidic fibroblast growth factor binding protein [Neocallimastix californiae]
MYTVFVTNSFVLDQDVFNYWLYGYSIDYTVKQLLKKNNNKISYQILKNYVHDGYRTCELIEPFLKHPKCFSGQIIFPISNSYKTYLVKKYYSFDKNVMRNLLGKKINSRTRKELDSISEKTQVPLIGCKRIFDNLKRIQKNIEDIENKNFIEEIKKEFYLPTSLARQYAHIIFINLLRLDTSKRKMASIEYSCFERAAAVFYTYWREPSNLYDFDEDLCQDFKELKANFFSIKDIWEEYRTKINFELQKNENELIINKGSQIFKLLLRNILTIGSTLSNSKENRNIFIQIIDKITEPCISVGLSREEVTIVFDIILSQFKEIKYFNDEFKTKYENSYKRLITGIQQSSLQFIP